MTKEKQVLTTAQDINKMMTKYQQQILMAIPRHMDAARIVRLVTTELSRNPDLQECDGLSIFGAVLQACQLGLEPGAALGHAYLVPFWNSLKGHKECSLIAGYRGMIELAVRSGKVQSIIGRAVYSNDEFDFEYGTEEKLFHKPTLGARGEFVCAYAQAIFKDGSKQFYVAGKDEIEAAKKRSAASGKGPWVTDYEAMAIKTPIRRLFKFLPISIEMNELLTLEDRADIGEQNLGNIIDMNDDCNKPLTREQEALEKLGEKIGEKSE